LTFGLHLKTLKLSVPNIFHDFVRQDCDTDLVHKEQNMGLKRNTCFAPLVSNQMKIARKKRMLSIAPFFTHKNSGIFALN